MHTQPLVSVILPTYNRAHLIRRSIESVLKQTYGNLELLVVDDGSKDDTEAVIRSFNDPRIRYVKHEVNRGVSAARNTGIKLATGDYIAFQDSDDEWLPQKLEKQLSIFFQDSTGNVGLVVCGYSIINEVGKEKICNRNKPLSYKDLLLHFTGYGEATQRFVLKKSITASELYFDESFPAWEEWDLLFRVSHTCEIKSATEHLVRYHRHDGPHVDIPNNRIQARKRLIKKYSTELSNCPKGLSYAHWQLALDYVKTGKMDRVRLHLKAAIRSNPWHVDYHLQYYTAAFGQTIFKLVFNLRHGIAVSIKQIQNLVSYKR